MPLQAAAAQPGVQMTLPIATRGMSPTGVRSSAKNFDFIGFFIIKSERIFLVLQREQTDLVELCFKHL